MTWIGVIIIALLWEIVQRNRRQDREQLEEQLAEHFQEIIDSVQPND